MQIRRTLAVAIVSALGLSGCVSSPAGFTDSDRTAIRSVIDDFTSAVNRSDFASAAAAYTPDGIVMPPNAPAVWGRAGIQKLFEGIGGPTAYSQPIVEVDGEGSVAYARVDYDLTMTPANAKTPVNDKGKILIVFRKQSDGKWRATRGIWNSNLAPMK
jgi:uncharacterized protein (TIGR02246 family)